MNSTEVHSLVRGVIVVYALPFAVVSVMDSLASWKVVVRAGTGELVRFIVASAHRDDMRWAIRQALEARRY